MTRYDLYEKLQTAKEKISKSQKPILSSQSSWSKVVLRNLHIESTKDSVCPLIPNYEMVTGTIYNWNNPYIWISEVLTKLQ